MNCPYYNFKNPNAISDYIYIRVTAEKVDYHIDPLSAGLLPVIQEHTNSCHCEPPLAESERGRGNLAIKSTAFPTFSAVFQNKKTRAKNNGPGFTTNL